MPITDAVIVAAIVAAFIVFAVVLAWGEYQTRHLSRPLAQAAAPATKAGPIETAQAPAAAGQGLNAAAS
ncbi:MAG: hypothetical protein WAK63_16775 [Xanthobacteraceae bacterium]